jgi:hypothetical protein
MHVRLRSRLNGPTFVKRRALEAEHGASSTECVERTRTTAQVRRRKDRDWNEAAVGRGASARALSPLAARTRETASVLSLWTGAPRTGPVHPSWRVVENDASAGR